VAQDPAVGDGRHVALEDVQVRPADRRRVDLDDDVRRVLDPGVLLVLPVLVADAVVDQCLHRRF
jgi:hypothetical protein